MHDTDFGKRSDDVAPHSNALIHETSPYLLQHAHNPVDWRPWGTPALAKARQEDKPIFLSIGYSACHWCHVMAHESFENEAIAEILNEHFVCIKVDREERPDLDDIYMTATVAQSGAGGWPMSVFLTPDLQPFYCGTYFPPTDRFGRPGFPKLLGYIAELWREKRDQVQQTAAIMTEHLEELSQQTTQQSSGRVDDRPLRLAVEQLRDNFDAQYGGWGAAPKFPPSASLSLLLRLHQSRREADLLEMAEHTLDHMAMGGLYDQVGGGFHRYSVDAQWLVPHFEKMLYDNAQLAAVYLEAYQYTRKPHYRRIAQETLDYVLRDMQHPEGPFYSAEDADSEGEEGKFYLWRKAEIVECLGAETAEEVLRKYQVQEPGNFASHEPYHEGQNILHRTSPELLFGEDAAAHDAVREQLRAYREKRVRPGLDDKILTSWNGLMISALAKGAQVLGNRAYSDAATAAARFILEHMRDAEGGLLRTHRNGKSHLSGYLDDYAFFGVGLLDLYEATFEVEWLDAAENIAAQMLDRFLDDAGESFYFTASTHEHLIVRMRPTFDGAEPSGNSLAAELLFRLGRLIGHSDYENQAHRVLATQHDLMCKAPTAFGRMLCLLHDTLQAPLEIALVGPRDSAALQALADVVHRFYLPHRQLAQAGAEEPETAARFPWILGATPKQGEVEARVCQAYACAEPVHSPDALQKQLTAHTAHAPQPKE